MDGGNRVDYLMKTIWDKLQDSFQGLNKSYPKGFTSREFAENTGVCLRVAREKIAALHAQGKVKFMGNRPTTRMDGRANVVPVYALTRK